MPVLQPGTMAPPFNLKTTPDQSVALEDFKGAPLILTFYPADWSPVCSDQLALYNELLTEFKKYQEAELLAISVDGIWCHLAFAENRKLQMPLLSDFEPKGGMAKAYGVYREKDGFCDRALFLIDKNGKIAWSYVSPLGVNPGADGLLQALDDLTKKTVKS